MTSSGIDVCRDLDGVDWAEMKADLAADHFDNGRTPDELRRSFEASFATALVWRDGRVVSTARMLADSVCNAYIVDVWTLTAYRRQGIASAVVRDLIARVPGHHVALFTDARAEFYRTLGFGEEPGGMSLVAGRWLNR